MDTHPAPISEDAIQSIYEGNDSFCIIPSGGQTVWYKIDDKSANRVMNVETPVSGEFAVYDANGMVVNFSKATSNHSVVLPEDGMIVFGGNEGDVFKRINFWDAKKRGIYRLFGQNGVGKTTIMKMITNL
ncbi:MAG: beta-lactamase [Paenibacillus sp.]|jgi:hypothetical protein|nr:beta-lactamase [Paenibacillus sp.]